MTKITNLADIDFKQIIKCVRERISDPIHWARGSYHSFKYRNNDTSQERVDQYCLLGAARLCATERGMCSNWDAKHDDYVNREDDMIEITDFDNEFARELGFMNREHAFAFNDKEATHEMVIAKLDSALSDEKKDDAEA